jgi:hypothetical protein
MFVESRSEPGIYVELLAEMGALAVICNCQQIDNPCNGGEPTPISLMAYDSP